MSGDTSRSDRRATVWMPAEMITEIDTRNTTPNRSQWVREAVRLRWAIDDVLEEAGADLPDDPADRRREIAGVLRAVFADPDSP